MSKYQSTKVVELGSCAFRQWRATHSHCQYLHGYQLKAKLWFGCNELDSKNWCVDFGGLNELKQHLKSLFDHTTTVAQDDPELETFKELDKKGLVQLRVFENGVGIERVAENVHEMANMFIKYLYGIYVYSPHGKVKGHQRKIGLNSNGRVHHLTDFFF